MLPKITTSHNVARSVTYNELKVKLGAAERLVAANFLKETKQLSTDDVIHRFQRRMELNDRVKTNLHITLNFDPQDEVPKERMISIMRSYMKEIGFERQPWVGWAHNDTGHPHCHIVTTHVRNNGDPIDLYNIGRNQSEKAREKIEAEFNLVTAEMKRQQRQQQKPAEYPNGARILTYGQNPLTRSISSVLEHVTDNYIYTSLEEFNAILRIHNIEAYRGEPGTSLHEKRGLLYRALDDKGHYIGRPLKASFFDCKPTLNNLEKKFTQNLPLKPEKKRLMEAIMCSAIFNNHDDLAGVTDSLLHDSVYLSLTRDKSGNCTGMSAVDVNRKVVFLGQDLDNRYNHRAIHKVIEAERLREAWELTHKHELRQSMRQSRGLRMGF